MSTATTGGSLDDTLASARDDLGQKVGAAADKARDLGKDASQLSGIASDLAGDAAQHGRALFDAAKGHATTFADERKNDAAQSIADIAASLRDTGGTFEGRANIQAFVGSAADGLDDLASTIRDRSFAELYAEAESFARRQPATVALGALAVGFLVARFIKSTSEDLADRGAERLRESRARRDPAVG